MAVALALFGGGAALADALVVTDREQLQIFAQSVTGEASERRIDAALQYTDPAVATVDVITVTQTRSFNDNNGSDLTAYAHKALASFKGNHLKLIQQTISFEGNKALVALRVRTDDGLANAIFKLERIEDRWLVRRMTIS